MLKKLKTFHSAEFHIRELELNEVEDLLGRLKGEGFERHRLRVMEERDFDRKDPDGYYPKTGRYSIRISLMPSLVQSDDISGDELRRWEQNLTAEAERIDRLLAAG